MPEYLILDKSLLHGTSIDELCRLVKTHNVVVSETLLYECLTTAKGEKDRMLARCRDVVLAGAFVCPTVISIVHAEARNLRPYDGLVDPECSDLVRRIFRGDATPYDPPAVERVYQNQQAFVDQIKTNIPRISEYLKPDTPQALQEKIECWGDDIQGSRPERLREYMRFLDCVDLHEAANTMLPGMTAQPEEFCLSKDWITWHFVRVFLALLDERQFCHQARGRLRECDLEHDCCDIEYVTFLSRADGLLMRDLLAQDIAKAAFPEKDVFSSLEEVPDSYRCDWAGN